MAVRTKNGRVVTDADLDRMETEAEAGYDLSTWKPRPGRPTLSLRDTGSPSPRIATRVPEELRAKVVSRASAAGKSVSQVMRSLLEGYAEERPATRKPAHRG